MFEEYSQHEVASVEIFVHDVPVDILHDFSGFYQVGNIALVEQLTVVV